MTTSLSVGVWIAVALLLAVFANQVEQFLDRRREKPSTKEVQLDVADRFATKRDLEKHVASDDEIHNKLFERVNASERGVEDRLNTRLDKIENDSVASRRPMHRDIDAIRADVAGMKERLALNGEQLKALSQQQTDMPAQIVALLNNTGALNKK